MNKVIPVGLTGIAVILAGCESSQVKSESPILVKDVNGNITTVNSPNPLSIESVGTNSYVLSDPRTGAYFIFPRDFELQHDGFSEDVIRNTRNGLDYTVPNLPYIPVPQPKSQPKPKIEIIIEHEQPCQPMNNPYYSPEWNRRYGNRFGNPYGADSGRYRTRSTGSPLIGYRRGRNRD